MRVRYETRPGQKLYVMGSIPELGGWKEFKCCMKWTEDHYWISDNLSIKSASYFQYKYAVKDDKEQDSIWELGIDRIADLAILPAVSDPQDPQVKSVELHDEWEHFTVKFSIFYPS